ncbi:hypothetical protein [Sphingomonas nostoxanthinifaciens]|uniref:hypothetical protein n=1 Tax=Sphingomonas nostoxanthinifaciens TaxID=2872652 RepID=UPI001CC1DDE9|nr:hypothetical protein [Sphingomonas nostoxanthinifaciens]UAK25546.1 hypothetical protein K8P63_05135 [Sphingomonas nostoxanthinifaciens]
MTEPSVTRLNLLRCGYLLLILGLGSQMAPVLIARGPALEVMHGIVLSMLCALGLLSILGLRYPLKMLPLLFFEMTWKLIWLVRIAVPLWTAHRIDDAVASTLVAVLMVVVFPFIIPWGYVGRTYFAASGDPWRSRPGAVTIR